MVSFICHCRNRGISPFLFSGAAEGGGVMSSCWEHLVTTNRWLQTFVSFVSFTDLRDLSGTLPVLRT